MAKLIYLANMSLDGYIEDRHGGFDFGPSTTTSSRRTPTCSGPSEPSSTGAACNETMAGRETMPALAASPPTLWLSDVT